MSQTHYVMDYETLANCFIGVFEKHATVDREIFIVWKHRNDIQKLISFLEENVKNNQWHISFNGLAFDAQLTHYILEHKDTFAKMDGEKLGRILYQKAQDVITCKDRGEFLPYSPNKMKIKQIDLFKMNHWDNPAKSSSLKWIQYSMDWYNIEEMPIHHTTEITSNAQIQTILDYCINDVRSTKEIMYLSSDQIMLRKNLTNEYKINLYSASEPRISKELFALFLSKKLGMKISEVKQMRTPRSHIVLADCILPYISFDTMEMQSLHSFMKKQIVTETKGALEYKIHYKGVDTYYGLGGIHGAAKSGVYEAKPGWTIMTSDVTSFYPNLAIRNGFHPAHLPKQEFLDLYEWFFDERKKIPKKDPKNYVYKIILNSTYGLSNDENSFLYDPMFTMQITINGQLLLSKLYEMLAEGIPGAVSLMQNTDGLEMMIPEVYKERYLEICAEWEKLCNLQLEHDEYSKLVLADVNNYIAIYKDGKPPKAKGRFEWEPQDKKTIATLHKNKSFLIIPKAVYNFFVHDIPPEQSLRENRNIYDYCAGLKAKNPWYFEERYSDLQEYKTNKLNKIVRYYISKRGVKLVKINAKDKREMQVNAGRWLSTTSNVLIDKRIDMDAVDINREYYLQAIYKEISNIDPKHSRHFEQLTFF